MALDASRIHLTQVLAGLGIGLVSAPIEEVIFRAVLQRRLAARFGTATGLGVSAALFAAVHAANAGANLQTVLTLALFGAVFLSLSYALTHSLAACIAAHATWNALVFGVLGGGTSGYMSEGALVSPRVPPPGSAAAALGWEGSVLTPVAAALAFAAVTACHTGFKGVLSISRQR